MKQPIDVIPGRGNRSLLAVDSTEEVAIMCPANVTAYARRVAAPATREALARMQKSLSLNNGK